MPESQSEQNTGSETWKQAPLIRSLLVCIGIGLVIWSIVQTSTTIRSSHWNTPREGRLVYQLTYSLSPEGRMRFRRKVEEFDLENDDVVSIDIRTREVGFPKVYCIEVWLATHSVSPNIWKSTTASPLNWEVAAPQIASEFQRRGHPNQQATAILAAPAVHIVHSSTWDAIESIWRAGRSTHISSLVMAAIALATIVFRHRLATLVSTALHLTKIGACECGYPLIPNAERCPECGMTFRIRRLKPSPRNNLSDRSS